jgi:EmrB/QacA subfamily drug resistance transporter
MTAGGMVKKRSVLLVITIASFLNPFLGSSITIALPSIGKEFGMTAVSLGWVATAFLLASAIFQVPFGRVADIHGRKKVFLLGVTLHAFSSLMAGFSNSTALLIASRALQGIAASMAFGTGVAILMSVFPPEERGKVLGINVTAVYTGLSTGPFFGGFLTQSFGWRSVFIVTSPLWLLILVLGTRTLKEERADAQGEQFDFVGSAIYSLTLVAIIYGLSELPSGGGALLILGGALGLFVLVRYETGTASPLFDVRLFKENRVFAFSNLAALINYSATFCVSFLLSLYLQYIKGLSPQKAGLILLSQPVVQAAFSSFTGRLSDRIEPRIVASMGMGVTVVGLSLLAFLNAETRIEYIMGSLILLGFGFALFSPPNTNAVMSSVEKKSYGVASGTIGTMRTTGMMLSMGMVMILFSMIIGRVQITPEYYLPFLKSAKIAFTVSAFLCAGGVYASLARGRLRQKGLPGIQ